MSGKKKLGVALIIIGLLLAIGGGSLSSQASNSYKGITVRSGYTIDGKYYDNPFVGAGTIGRNSEAMAHYESVKMAFILCGLLLAGTGAFVCIRE